MRTSVTEDFYQLRWIATPEYFAEKNLLVYALCQANQKQDTPIQQIILKDLTTGEEHTISAGGTSEANPRFSPDGTRLAFISDASGENQIWIADLASAAVQQITTMRYGVSELQWSPSGEKIVFLSSCAAQDDPDTLQIERTPDEKQAFLRERAMQPVVVEDYGYRNENAMGFAPRETSHLWVVDLKTTQTIRLSDGNHDYVMPIWSPDGERIIFVSNRARPKDEYIGMDLFSVSATGGEIEQLTHDIWVAYYPVPLRPMFSPDGHYIVVAGLEPSLEYGVPTTHFYRISAEDGTFVSIWPETAPCYEATAFPYNGGPGHCYNTAQISSDGRYIYFVSGWQGETNIYRANLVDEPEIIPFATGKQVFRGIGLPQNGKMIVLKGSPRQIPEVFLMDEATAILEQLTITNPFLDDVDLSAPEELWINTLDGKGKVHGWVLPPQQMQPGQQYPAVVYIHGGPTPYYTYGLSLEHQALAGAGIGVIYLNFRGTGGYGAKHAKMAQAFDGTSYYDILQFVDEAVKTHVWIDSDRLGVTGGSYGGYMTNYIAGHSQRFKAAVTQRSIANQLISYASSDMAGSSKNYDCFSDFMAAQIKDSPVAYADQINIPFLILHSTGDMRCPVEHAHQLFVAVKDTHPDLPVRLMLFPKSNHNLLNDGPMALRVAHYDAMINWFKQYL